MKYNQCDVPYPEQTDVSIEGPNFSIIGITTNYHGYVRSFCYSCDIKPDGLPTITYSVDNI